MDERTRKQLERDAQRLSDLQRRSPLAAHALSLSGRLEAPSPGDDVSPDFRVLRCTECGHEIIAFTDKSGRGYVISVDQIYRTAQAHLSNHHGATLG